MILVRDSTLYSPRLARARHDTSLHEPRPCTRDERRDTVSDGFSDTFHRSSGEKRRVRGTRIDSGPGTGICLRAPSAARRSLREHASTCSDRLADRFNTSGSLRAPFSRPRFLRDRRWRFSSGSTTLDTGRALETRHNTRGVDVDGKLADTTRDAHHGADTDRWLRAESNWSRGHCVRRPVGLAPSEMPEYGRRRTKRIEVWRSTTGRRDDRVTGYHGDRDLFPFEAYALFGTLAGNCSDTLSAFNSFSILIIRLRKFAQNKIDSNLILK